MNDIQKLLCAALCMTPPLAASAVDKPSKPNIVFIYCDDIGFGDLGCYGSTNLSTPNIDRLASEGQRFVNGYATASVCTPSRYSLLTGEYSFRNKDAQILDGDAGLLIPPGTPTLPELLRKAGYATGVVGKWHLGLGDGSTDWNREIKPGPLEIGFDYSFIIPTTPDRVPCVYVEDRNVVGLDADDPIEISYQHPVGDEPTASSHPELLRYPPSDELHSGTIVNGISRIGWMKGGQAARWKDEEMAETLLKKAVRFMEESRDRPFFLYYAMHDIHVPRAPADRFLGTTSAGIRGDMVMELDWAVGEFMAALRRLGLEDNTLIVFSCDNGPLFEDGYVDGSLEAGKGTTPAGPFRGGKYHIFEAGTRLPFLTWWPGQIRPGVSKALVSQVDLFASLADLLKLDIPEGAARDSENLLPALLGRSPEGRTELIQQSPLRLSLVQGDWKYIPPGKVMNWSAAALPGNTAGAPDTPDAQLYNLADDEGETRNLVQKHPERAREMAERLREITGNLQE